MTQYNNKIDLNKRIDVQIQASEMNNSQRNISVNLNVFLYVPKIVSFCYLDAIHRTQ